MAQQLDDRKRRLIPRWRPFQVAARLELLRPATTAPRTFPAPLFGEIEALLSDWKRHQSQTHAAALVDAALVTGRREDAVDAAQFLLRAGQDVATNSVARALIASAEQEPSSGDPLVLGTEERHRRIARIRIDLRRSPRDPVRWVDLARDYAILAQNGPAERALRIALSLAPENRFVLRSAARYYLHSGEPDKAHQVLRRAGRTKQDPWLLAAELVTATFLGKTSRWVKLAEQMVERRGFEPRHISELAGALGSLEHEHGARRKTRRLFDKALIDPTENTLAQAGWIARHTTSFEPPSEVEQIPRAYEAGAWDHVLHHEYGEALRMARRWLDDEPFATRPALFGSWVASTALDDFSTAASFAEAARQANPDDPRPLAQLVFCYASQNKLPEAELALELVNGVLAHNTAGRDKEEWGVLLAANRGLIAYRQGRVQDGRMHYESAVRQAIRSKKSELAAGALVYFAREEARVNPSAGDELIQQARAALDAWPIFLRQAYQRALDRAARPQTVGRT